MEQDQSSFKRFQWLLLVVLVIITISGCSNHSDANAYQNKNIENNKDEVSKTNSKYPSCPENLSGILTYPLMEPKYISGLIPLGNINPPGHTSPVDHIYFATDYDGRIPLYAPADAWITSIIAILQQDNTGNYTTTGYVVQYTVCKGLVLDFASYTDIIQPIKNILDKQKPECHYGIVKPGHEGGAEGQCNYQINYPVKSGEEIGWVQRYKRENDYDLPFEIWAADYNKLPPSQTNWDYYDDNRYAHIICPFDLYSNDLKNEYGSKFGVWKENIIKDNITGEITKDDSQRHFVARNGLPICGQVDQDIVGTIQGTWFGGKPGDKGIEFAGKVIAFLHNNIDVNQGEVSIGGDLAEGKAATIFFTPMHAGTIDREPSEIKNDGKIYCYNAENNWQISGKILVQLIDDYNIKAEHQSGTCSSNESFKNSFEYER